MNTFTPDGRHLLVLDAFGLSRLTLPDKIKTERKYLGSDLARLSVDAAGGRAVVFADHWNEIGILELPSLKNVVKTKRFEHSGAVSHPDGSHLVREHQDLVSVDPKTGATSLVRNDGARALAPLLIGPDRSLAGHAPDVLAVSPDGAFASFRRGAGELLIGDFDGAVPVVRLRIPLRITLGGVVSLHPFAKATIVLAHEPRTSRVHGARIAADGSVRTFELPALARPAVPTPDEIVAQVEPARVARLSLDGAELGSYAIPGADAASAPGEIAAHANGNVLFIPPDRESIVDLNSRLVVDRKLPPAQRAARKHFVDLLERYRASTTSVGVSLLLAEVRYSNKDTVAFPAVSVTQGDGSLTANLLTTMLRAEGVESGTVGGIRVGGGSFAEVPLLGVADVDDVNRFIDACDRSGLWLGYAVEGLLDVHRRRLGMEGVWANESNQLPLTPRAAQVLVRATLQHLLASPTERPALPADRTAWADAPLTAEELTRALVSPAMAAPHVAYRAYEAFAAMTIAYASPAVAAPVLVAMMLDGAEEQLNNSASGVCRAASLLAERSPETLAVMRALTEQRADYVPKTSHGYAFPNRREELQRALSR